MMIWPTTSKISNGNDSTSTTYFLLLIFTTCYTSAVFLGEPVLSARQPVSKGSLT